MLEMYNIYKITISEDIMDIVKQHKIIVQVLPATLLQLKTHKKKVFNLLNQKLVLSNSHIVIV